MELPFEKILEENIKNSPNRKISVYINNNKYYFHEDLLYLSNNIIKKIWNMQNNNEIILHFDCIRDIDNFEYIIYLYLFWSYLSLDTLKLNQIANLICKLPFIISDTIFVDKLINRLVVLFKLYTKITIDILRDYFQIITSIDVKLLSTYDLQKSNHPLSMSVIFSKLDINFKTLMFFFLFFLDHIDLNQHSDDFKRELTLSPLEVSIITNQHYLDFKISDLYLGLSLLLPNSDPLYPYITNIIHSYYISDISSFSTNVILLTDILQNYLILHSNCH